MAFQGITEKHGDFIPLAELKGSALIGTKVKAPFSVHKEVYVLPMDGVLATKVPSYFPFSIASFGFTFMIS